MKKFLSIPNDSEFMTMTWVKAIVMTYAMISVAVVWVGK